MEYGISAQILKNRKDLDMKKQLKEEVMWELPGCLMVRIPGFHCRGQVQSLVGELRST